MNHQPTPEFERYLEWQISSAMRRQERFARPASSRGGKIVVTAAIAIASMLVGAGGVAASASIQEGKDRQLLVLQHVGEIKLAELQLAMAQQSLDEVKRKVATGLAGESTLRLSLQETEALVLKLQRLKLKMEEVQLSGKPVGDDLTSPKVDGRDFVSQRLELELRAAALNVNGSERALADATRRVEVGLSTERELLDLRGQHERAVLEVRLLQDQLELRKRFLSGALSVEQTTQLRLRATMENELRAATSALAEADRRYAYVQRQFRVGLATEVEMLKAQVEMLEKKHEVTMLQERLKTIK